jgi:hypothetical protein
MGSLSTPGTLKILVIGAESLDTIVTAGTQQPYYIIECGKQRSRSKPCLNNGSNPHWNTAHKFELLDETAAVAVIKDEATKGIIAEGLIDLSRWVGCVSSGGGGHWVSGRQEACACALTLCKRLF